MSEGTNTVVSSMTIQRARLAGKSLKFMDANKDRWLDRDPNDDAIFATKK
jgi:hypothetical protein